jgi:subtilisin family serine protease
VKSCFQRFVALSLTSLLFSCAIAQAQKQLEPVNVSERKTHPTRILAKFLDAEKERAAASLLQQQGLQVRKRFGLVPGLTVLDESGNVAAAAAPAVVPTPDEKLASRIAALKASGLFEYVEPDFIRTINAEPTDSAFTDGTLWALKNTGQNGGTNGADIGAVAAWDITTGSTNVIVAVLDTGIRYTHQDLTNQMWRNSGEIPDNGIDDDDDGYVDNVYGINAITGSGNPMDDNGHGTHVSGTIGAAANDGHRHVGVAWNVRLMACKALDAIGGSSSYVAYVSDTIECIVFAVAKGARIINASYGSPAYSQTEFEAIRAARDQGVLFVAAAGNRGVDADSSWLRSYPASHELENIISVAAVDRFDQLSIFSNFGQTRVHLAAPGEEILSCWAGSDSQYRTIDGTSMATPHVVGVAALICSHYPAATMTEVRRRILDGAVPSSALTNRTVTGGRLNAFNSLVVAPSGVLEIEVFPRPGQTLGAGNAATLSVAVSDLRRVTNASVTASLATFTNLTLFDSGNSPDVVQGDAIYTTAFVVPTNLSTLEVTMTVSVFGWPSVTNRFSYPVALPPPNDHFADRTTIPPNNCLVVVSGSNLDASREAGEPDHGSGPSGRSVWWSWTAPFTGPVKLSTAGSSIITLLGVYTGNTVSNLALVAANDHPSYWDWYSAVRFDAVAGTEYQIAVDGIGPDNGQISLQVLPLTPSAPLSAASLSPGVVLKTGGDEPWFAQNCAVQGADASARSGPIEASSQSWVETVIPGPGTLVFWWKVSSEFRYDFLRFSINGVQQASISGEANWQQMTYPLRATMNRLRWTYSKDYVVTAGQDAGWVDEIEVSFAPARTAIPARFGDLDGDRQPTVLDLTLLVGYLGDTNSLPPQVALYADVNNDSLVNSDDIPALADAILGRA